MLPPIAKFGETVALAQMNFAAAMDAAGADPGIAPTLVS